MKTIMLIGMFFIGLNCYSQTAAAKVVKHEAKKEVKKSVGIETSPKKTVKKAVGLEPTPAEKTKKAITKSNKKS